VPRMPSLIRISLPRFLSDRILQRIAKNVSQRASHQPEQNGWKVRAVR
jgi:hypothetical protein